MEEGADASEEALAILRDQCVGVTWELNIAQNLVIWALMYLGELGELSRRVPRAPRQRAEQREPVHRHRAVHPQQLRVAGGRRSGRRGARKRIESIARWSHKGFHRQHYSAMLARMQTALYRGDADAAWRLLAELESMLRRSMLTRVQVMRIESLYLRARSALAMAARHGPRRRFLSVARAGARRIAGERMPWSDPIALLLEAGDRVARGQHGASPSTCLHDAVDRFDRADMKLYAAVARRRLGALQDDRAAASCSDRPRSGWPRSRSGTPPP